MVVVFFCSPKILDKSNNLLKESLQHLIAFPGWQVAGKKGSQVGAEIT